MKLNDNITFKVELYNIGDFFRKYHNGLMFNNNFDQLEIMQDAKDLVESVKRIKESLDIQE